MKLIKARIKALVTWFKRNNAGVLFPYPDHPNPANPKDREWQC